MRKKLCTIFLSVTIALSCFPICAFAQEPGDSYEIHYMNGVKPAMVSADFWVGDAGKAKLMDMDEIEALNARNFATPETHMNLLSSRPDTYNGISMRDSLASFTNPKNLYLNEAPVPDSYYDAIRQNIAGANAADSMPVGYGIILNRTIMKSLPYSDFLSDGLGDSEWDNLVNSAALVNEPVLCYLKTADGKYTYIKSEICEGWIPSEDVVLCHSKQEWLDIQDMSSFLVVTGDRIILEASSADTSHSDKALDMGTKLELIPGGGMVDNRMQWYNYVVLLPGVGADGYYAANQATIPMSRDVHVGYMELTQENLINQAMKCLGDRYGWGGMLESRDCSSFVREVYLCFGLILPRNTTWQGSMPVNIVDMTQMNLDEKKKFLEHLPAGAILQFPGHEMLYLGKSGNDYFTVNDVSSLVINNENGTPVRYRGRGVVINGLLDTKRANGHTWAEELSKAIIPWE